MQEVKISELITMFDFVCGIMKIIPHKSPENFLSAIMLYHKSKTLTVSKSSVRLVINKIEYSFNLQKKEELKFDFSGDVVSEENEELAEENNTWNKTLTDGLIRNIIINHFVKLI